MFDTSGWLNIAGIFNKEREKKKELFLKSYHYLSPIKILLYFKCILVLKSFGCVISSINSSSVAYICFVSLSLILAKRLITP